MVFAFKARVQDPEVASYRYRALQPIAALRARGQAVEPFDEQRFDRYEAVLFGKAFGSEDQALARRLAAAGKRVLLDLNDNLFFNPRDLPMYRQVREDLLQMIALSDGVVCSTPYLAEVVRREAGLAQTPAVAPDPYEQAPVAAGPPTPADRPAQLLWFGRFGSPNAPAGLEDLKRIRQVLADAAALRPLELTVCSDSRKRFEKVTAGFPVPVRYLDWTPSVFAAELARTDAVVIPLSDNPFVAAKTHNRLSLALSAGAPVVADSIDSYREFDRFAYLDDWRGGLEAVLLRPDEARARARGARDYLETNWSMEALAPQWERALGLPAGRIAAGAGRASVLGSAAPPCAPALDWLRLEGRPGRPWLLAGEEADPRVVDRARGGGFLVMSVGCGFTRFAADASCVIDLETATRHGAVLEAQGGMVIAPGFPHQSGWASRRPLEDWAGRVPALERLHSQGRLTRFDLWTGATDGIPGDVATEEVPLRLLVAAGVRMARRLGVPARRPATAGFEAAHPMSDRQGRGIARLRRTSGLSYAPYGFPVPARVFVGSDDEQLIGFRLLDYSIQIHASMDVTVEVLDYRRAPVPKDPKNRSKTGFSFCRFDIPRLCGHQGRGIYMDADMQVFGDIADLWTLPMEAADVLHALTHPSQGRTPQTSVMLLNCAALGWDVEAIVAGLDEGRYGYKDLMQKLCIHPAERVKPGLPFWWNSLERYDPGRTCLIHFTDMPRQPWVSHDNPNGELWYAALREALAEGFIRMDEVEQAIRRGHVSPRLLQWIGLIGARVDEQAAQAWTAPYTRFAETAA